MHLLIVPIENDASRTLFEEMIEKEPSITDVNWFSTESKTPRTNMDYPQIVGNIRSIFGYESREVVHLFVKGEDNTRYLAQKIKEINRSCNRIYSIPLAAM